ncbi:stalk domain-containing protein [Vreelandella neptunia]|uniref:stalk domain-containing protein n=1 Tax=Vreelandella neptunia TaxID=115551 RepID=UPI00315AEC5E
MNKNNTLLSLTLASSLLLASPAIMAHGGSPDYVPIEQALVSSGATYELADDNSELRIRSGEADIRVPVGDTQALYNGETVELSAPIRLHDGDILVERSFVHDLFKDHVPQTVSSEGRPHPLDSLTAEEISQASADIKSSENYTDNMRFTEIRLADPDKGRVWDWYFGGSHDFERHAEFTVLDGRKVIEGTLNLASGDILRWEPIEGAHGMVTFDDFMAVQTIVSESEAYKEALRGARYRGHR